MTDGFVELVEALSAAQAALQRALAIMIREPALTALVGQRLLTAQTKVHRAQKQLGSTLTPKSGSPEAGNNQPSPVLPKNLPTHLETQKNGISVDFGQELSGIVRTQTLDTQSRIVPSIGCHGRIGAQIAEI